MDAQTKKTLTAAKKLIEAGDYERAKRLLSGIDHPTAKKWSAKLDERIAEQVLGDPFADIPKHKNKVPETRERSNTGIGCLILLVVGILGVLWGSGSDTSSDPVSSTQTAVQQLPELSQARDVFRATFNHEPKKLSFLAGTSENLWVSWYWRDTTNPDVDTRAIACALRDAGIVASLTDFVIWRDDEYWRFNATITDNELLSLNCDRSLRGQIEYYELRS